MKEVQFRNFHKKDIENLAKLAVDAWPIVSSLVPVQDIPKLMKAYVQINRIGSTWLEVAMIDDKIVGFLFGRLNKDYTALDRIKSIIPSLWILLKIRLGKYGKLAEPMTFLKQLMATEQKVQFHTPQADGEVMLFVVDSSHRGKGIGRALLNRFLKRARFLNSRLISVYTDPLSNWRFYEKYGFERYGTFIDDLNTYIKKTETEGFIYIIAV